MEGKIDHHTLKILEFPKIRDIIKTYLVSDLGLAKIETIVPEVSDDLIRRRLKETSEIKDILITKGEIPLQNVKEDGKIFEILMKKEPLLEITQILYILDILLLSRRIKGFFSELETSYPNINLKIKDLFISPSLEQKILKVLNREGDVLDGASIELGRIRRKIKKKKEDIKAKLNILIEKKISVVQEPIITVRDNRYVIPLKPNFNKYMKGIVHGMSASRATVFVEPLEILDLNNKIVNLKVDEEREKFRILKRLTGEIKKKCKEIETNINLLAEIDLITAKAKYSIESKSIEPLFNPDGRIKFIQARNPFLEWKRKNLKECSVPIDVIIGQDFNILVITGPNTGGKTVSLKTVGLLSLMLQAGMHIPVKEGSETSIFKKIFADVGDEQSIQQNLSTFSSHIKQIIKIIKESDSSSLVLLDELGAGTEPSEGTAIGIAILEDLRKKRAKTLVTTHHNSLKVFAHSYKDVENASVEFDSNTLRPTYRLIYGYSGKSNAFYIAKNLGLPQELIMKAMEEVKKEKKEVDKLIDRLEDRMRDIEKIKNEISKERWEILEGKKEQLLLLEELRRKKSLFSKESKIFLKEAKSEIEVVINNLKKKKEYKKEEIQFPHKEFDIWKSKLKDFEKLPYKEERSLLEPKPGERVKIKNLDLEGIVKRIKSSSIAEVQVGLKKIQVPIDDLNEPSKIQEKESKNTIDISVSIKKDFLEDFSTELNVIGNKVDEALPKVDKYLDNAKLNDLKMVKIIHGKGTGRLKKAIFEMLQDHPHVKNFHCCGLNEGGWGATIVEIVN